MRSSRHRTVDRSNVRRLVVVGSAAFAVAALFAGDVHRRHVHVGFELQVAESIAWLLIAVMLYSRIDSEPRYRVDIAFLAYAMAGSMTMLRTAVRSMSDSHHLAEAIDWLLIASVMSMFALLIAVAVRSFDRRGAARRPTLLSTAKTLRFLALSFGVAAAFGTAWGLFGPEDPDPMQLLDDQLGRGIKQTVAFVASAVLASGASIAIWRLAASLEDELLRWMGSTLAINAFGYFSIIRLRGIGDEWLTSRDVLRFVSVLVLAAGCSQEIMRMERRRRVSLVSEERQRVVRDLHDGLAQELAFLVSTASTAARPDDPTSQLIAASAQRSLDAARLVISTFTSADVAMPLAVLHAAEEATRRYGIGLIAEISTAAPDRLECREAVVRVTLEAITNAARHGDCSAVTVTLEDSADIRLRIVDDGTGFDVATVPAGYGMRFSRERVEQLDGTFTVTSEPGGGTAVSVVIPRPKSAGVVRR